jgi:hypothetical protein
MEIFGADEPAVEGEFHLTILGGNAGVEMCRNGEIINNCAC